MSVAEVTTTIPTTFREQVFVTLPEAAGPLGFSRSALYRVAGADRRFPRPVVLPGRKRPLYRVADLLKWANSAK